jgi:hypothetical protein
VVRNILLIFATCMACLMLNACHKNSPPDITTPKTMHPVVTIEADTPQRIKDLSALAYALEKYKQDHQQYPVSSNAGRGYDGLFASEKYGESRVEWIRGLVPEYIDELPRDPRNDSVIYHSYLYVSNGANYKLFVQRPEDCQEVKQKYPQLIDPRRDCYAYGYWTPKAVNW